MADERKPKRSRPRRQNGVVDVANGFLTLVVIAILAAGGLIFFAAQQFYSAGPKEAETAFLVEKDSGLGSVADRLESQGLISNHYIFLFGGKALKKDRAIKPGQYMVPARASMSDILKLITEGKPVDFFVTVPEGETSFRAAERIRQASNSLAGELPNDPPEGSILPGRYDYFPMDTRQSVLDQMTTGMSKAVAEVWATHDPAIDTVVHSPAEMVTLASIVERETGIASERPQVAAVFINRLKKHMRLQSDPTIIYGITLGKTKLDRPLKKSEIEADTPYNTYQIDGLPMGPIANPGIDALKAVAHPAPTNDLYFVAKTADPADGHLFAASYAEHKQNVLVYRKAVKDASAADADAAKDALEAAQAAKTGDTVTN